MDGRVAVIDAVGGVEHCGLNQGSHAGGEQRRGFGREDRGEHILVPIADFVSASAAQAGETCQYQAGGEETSGCEALTFHKWL